MKHVGDQSFTFDTYMSIERLRRLISRKAPPPKRRKRIPDSGRPDDAKHGWLNRLELAGGRFPIS